LYGKSKRAWSYCRIDTPENTHGVLKGQHEKLDSYAGQMCFTVVSSSHDLGNGLTLNRPSLTELMEAVKIGKLDISQTEITMAAETFPLGKHLWNTALWNAGNIQPFSEG